VTITPLNVRSMVCCFILNFVISNTAFQSYRLLLALSSESSSRISKCNALLMTLKKINMYVTASFSKMM